MSGLFNRLKQRNFSRHVPGLIYFLYNENKTYTLAPTHPLVGVGTGNRRSDLSLTGAL